MDFPFGFIFHCDFGIKSLKVESLSNGSHIKFEIDQTFSRLPYDFSFVLKKVGLCSNHLITLSNFCSTFAQCTFAGAQRRSIKVKAMLHEAIFLVTCLAPNVAR